MPTFPRILRFTLLAAIVVFVAMNFTPVVVVTLTVLVVAIPLGLAGKLLQAVVFFATGKG